MPHPTPRAIEQACWRLLEPVVSVGGFELIEVEFVHDEGRWVLRLYIDSPEGVTIADTTTVTHLVDPVLDVEDPIPHSYHLEVSSPGLDRPLRKPEHFQRFAGEKVRIRTFEKVPTAGNRRNYKGVLKGYEDGKVLIDVDGTLFEVPHEDIQRAQVEYQFDREQPR